MSRCPLLQLLKGPCVRLRLQAALLLFFAFGTPALAGPPNSNGSVNGPAPVPVTELASEEQQRLAPAPGRPILPEAPFDRTYVPQEAQRFRELRREIRPAEFSAAGLNVRALEGYLDYDEQNQILYGPGRTQVIYGDVFLEADRLVLDQRLQEVQAEGNVIFRYRGADRAENEIIADSMRYNFGEDEGVAFEADGFMEPLYFETLERELEDDKPPMPQVRQLSQNESIFRDTAVTTCDFKVPHYNIRAREIIIYPQDRIFFRRATLAIAGVPVFYFPFYTRSLDEGSSWFVQIGSGGQTGTRIRIGYQYDHSVEEPSFEDEDEYETRSSGVATVWADYLSERGFGSGLNYEYLFEFGRHRGELQVYGLQDSEREVGDADLDRDQDLENEEDRWQLYWRHRSEITEDLFATINVDMFSDPEFFYDILDAFDEVERGRQPVRRARGALTYLKEAYVLRMLVEVKDRVGVDRFGDFSNPADDNLDFEFDPTRQLDDQDPDGITQDRWGRVSKKLPQLTFATRYMPVQRFLPRIGDEPLYTMKEINVFNNLDKGLNVVDTDDDAWVRGIDIYDQLLWQYRITERYVLIAKLGAGIGAAQRDDDDLGIDFEDRPLDPDGDGWIVDSLIFSDDDGTFLIGDEEFNHDDIETLYAWVDAALRLNARFTDALSGFIEWSWRETTDDFIGDFYAEIGDRTSQEDLFPFRLREHWLRGNLTYNLLYPVLTAFMNAGVNLDSRNDVFPSEELWFWNTGLNWQNQRGTLRAGTAVGMSSIQVFHPSDSREGSQEAFFYTANATYSPVHGRWFTRVQYRHVSTSGTKAERGFLDDRTSFSDEDDRDEVTVTYGRELGKKWDAEITLKYDSRVSGFRDIELALQRDLHDALLIIAIERTRDVRDVDSRDDNPTQIDVSLGLEIKLPDEDVAFGPGPIRTINRPSRRPVLAY